MFFVGRWFIVGCDLFGRRLLKNLANRIDAQSFTGTAGHVVFSHGFATVHSLRMALPDRFHDNIYIVAQGVGSIVSCPPSIIDLPEIPESGENSKEKVQDVVTDSSAKNLGK